MNALIPLFAAIFQAASSTTDKVLLSAKKLHWQQYLGISFPLLFFTILPLFLIFKAPISYGLFFGKSLLLIAASSLISIFNNLLYYRALESDTLGELNMFDLLKNVPVVLVTGLIFADERNLPRIFLAIVASCAVIWSHWENHHFQIIKKTKFFFISSLALAPLTAIVAKELLQTWNPITMELVKNGVVALAFAFIFFNSTKHIPLKTFPFLVLTNALSAIAFIMFYFSYQKFGVIYTTLFFSLQPLLVYFASLFVLKEQLKWKRGMAFLIVLIAIAAAQII